jgi:hypothetical protein
MSEGTFGFPMTKRAADREARLREMEDWLDGDDSHKTFHNTPEEHPKNPTTSIPVEVGDRVDPYAPKRPRGPGITVIEPPEDDRSAVRTSWGTVLTPGKRGERR